MNTYENRLEAIKKSLRYYHQKSLLTKSETSKELGISTQTLDRMRKEKRIASRKIRGKVMFNLDSIAHFLIEDELWY